MGDPKIAASLTPIAITSETGDYPVPSKDPKAQIREHTFTISYGEGLYNTIILKGYEVGGDPGSEEYKKYVDHPETYRRLTLTYQGQAGIGLKKGESKIVTETKTFFVPVGSVVALDEKLTFAAHAQLRLVTGNTIPHYQAVHPLGPTPFPLQAPVGVGGGEPLTEGRRQELVSEMTRFMKEGSQDTVMLVKARFYNQYKGELTTAQFDAIFTAAAERRLIG